MQCYQCQANIPDGAEFCIACGKRQSRAATGSTRRINPPPATGTTRLLNLPALLRSLNDLPRKQRERIQTELAPTERITWIDKPVPRFFTPITPVLLLWGIIFTGLGLLPGALAVLLLGLLLLSSPLVGWWMAFRSVYLITNQRAMIVQGRSVESFTPDQFTNVYRRKSTGGTWDVIIRTEMHKRRRGNRYNHYMVEKGFEGLENAEEAERQLKELEQRYLATGLSASAPPQASSQRQAP